MDSVVLGTVPLKVRRRPASKRMPGHGQHEFVQADTRCGSSRVR